MDARPIPALRTHSAFTEIVTAVVGRWQHFVSADPAQKANPVLPRRVTVPQGWANFSHEGPDFEKLLKPQAAR